MIHYSQILSDFVYNLKYEDLPLAVVDTTKRYIADYYAASFAGIKVNGTFNDAVIGVISEMGGKQECDYIYSETRLPAANAAFLSACMAHGADMDDGNRKAMGHVGAHVISTALTLCQTLDVRPITEISYFVYTIVEQINPNIPRCNYTTITFD